MSESKIYIIIAIIVTLLSGCATTTVPNYDILKMAEDAEAVRPGGRKALYVCSSKTGGALGSLDSLDIIGTGNPNTYDLIDGDLATVGNQTDGRLFYTYVADATYLSDGTKYIRPEDYDTNGPGVFVKVDDPNSTLDGIIMCDGAGNCSAAVPGTDYMSPDDVAAAYQPIVTVGSLPDGTVTGDDIYTVINLSGHSVTLPNLVLNPDPATNETWQGNITPGIAGENLSAGDLVYRKYDTDGHRYFRFSSDSTFADNDIYRIVGIAIESATTGSGLTIGIGHGVWRQDSYSFVDAQDEGLPVFVGETAGTIQLTKPSDSGDHIIHIGDLFEEDEVEFKFTGYQDVEVP